MKVKINITRTTKIRCNGQEYASVEEMPADVRAIYEKSLASAMESGGVPEIKTTTKIVLNGQEYASVDQMPAGVRQLYERAIGSATANSGHRITFRFSLGRFLLLTFFLAILGLVAWLVAVHNLRLR